jgi:phage terminase large subunit-like protein
MTSLRLSPRPNQSIEAEVRRRRIARELQRRQLAHQPVLLAHQQPPSGSWFHWVLLSGRGGGKTFAAAYYVDKYARDNPGHRIAIIAPTLGDARNTCVDGVTGLLSFNRRIEINRSSGHLLWPSGAQGQIFGAHTDDDAERLRGPQHHLVWFEEMAAARKLDASWQNMRFGLRLGSRPHAIISTTPKPRPLLKQLLSDPNTVVTRATTADNPYLHEAVRGELYRLYEGTRIGRQELGGEIIDDNPDALWSRALIESTRVTRMPELERVIVSVDPSATSTGNECGIVVAGRSAFVDRVADGYLLDDLSLQGSPRAWAAEAVSAYHKWGADRIVAETNQGGEMVRQVIEAIDPSVSYRGVHARFGKRLRAEPIASRYEQGRVHHVGVYPEIEDQLCMWQPGDESPDRLDALVHAFTDLLIVKPEIEFSLV